MFETFKKWIPFKREEKKSVPQAAPRDHAIAQLHRDMNQLFGRMFDNGNLFSWPGSSTSRFDGWFGDFSPSEFSPAIDIADEKKHLKITADLPGMDAEDIELDVRDNALVIRGEKKLEESSEEDGYYRTERAYGLFERVVPLPSEVDADHAEALFRNGVLTVRLPKVPEAREHGSRIAIKAG